VQNSTEGDRALTNRRPEEWRESSEQAHKHAAATEAFLRCVQLISKQAEPKLIEATPP